MNFLHLLFGFHGRINRAQFWLGNLIAGLAGGVLIFALTIATSMSFVATKKPADVLLSLGSFMLSLAPVLLVMCWCGFAIQIKRLHDRGRSGWLVLIPLVLGAMIVSGIVGGIATGASGAAVASSIQPLVLLAQLVQLAFFIDLGCLGSQPAPNKHGDPPGATISRPPPSNAPGRVEAPALLKAQAAMDAAIAAKDAVGLVPGARGAPPMAAPSPARATPAPARVAPTPTRQAPAAPSFGRRPAAT